MSKTYHETIHAKQLISNLFLVAYKLFLYKILIKAATEAHRNDGLIALRCRGRSNFQDFWTRRRGASLVRMIIKNQKSKNQCPKIKGELDTFFT